MFDLLFVGAGFAGAVVAEQMARNAQMKVLVVDKRPHVAGNAYDHLNSDGILVHKYGPTFFTPIPTMYFPTHRALRNGGLTSTGFLRR